MSFRAYFEQEENEKQKLQFGAKVGELITLTRAFVSKCSEEGLAAEEQLADIKNIIGVVKKILTNKPVGIEPKTARNIKKSTKSIGGFVSSIKDADDPHKTLSQINKWCDKLELDTSEIVKTAL